VAGDSWRRRPCAPPPAPSTGAPTSGASGAYGERAREKPLLMHTNAHSMWSWCEQVQTYLRPRQRRRRCRPGGALGARSHEQHEQNGAEMAAPHRSVRRVRDLGSSAFVAGLFIRKSSKTSLNDMLSAKLALQRAGSRSRARPRQLGRNWSCCFVAGLLRQDLNCMQSALHPKLPSSLQRLKERVSNRHEKSTHGRGKNSRTQTAGALPTTTHASHGARTPPLPQPALAGAGDKIMPSSWPSPPPPPAPWPRPCFRRSGSAPPAWR
jgi:hypothetical protein